MVLSTAMVERRQFQSWFSKAPWAAFGLAAVVLLAGQYLIARLILWTGWNLFLPGTHSPFIPVEGLAVLYFGVGRMIFFGAPVVIGWGIGLLLLTALPYLLWQMTRSPRCRSPSIGG